MIAVYYSLVADGDGTRERQWARSVASLRQHNPGVAVVLCLYGRARDETFAAADRTGTHIRPMGEFADALGDIPGHWRAALSAVPTLHKLLSLRELVTEEALSRLIYLDCDTYFFGDVADLDARYAGCDWYAREEHANETALDEIARREGLVPVRPYNTGVVIFTAELGRTLATLLDDFVWYAWRLQLGLCLWRPELAEPALVQLIGAHASEAERRLALPYPADTAWIMEEIATWLTLGRIPGLTHDLLRQGDVAQGDECAASSADPIVAHYFSSREHEFFAC